MRTKQFNSSSDVFLLLRSKKSDYWVREQKKRTLALFHATAQRVPAYKDFLAKEKIRPHSIRTWEDFQHVTPVDKNNYFRAYPLAKMCWDGTLARLMTFTATSGSTGDSVYFVRDKQLEFQYSLILEEFIRQGMSGQAMKPVLVIVCFGMGLWIGGTITYQAFELAALRNRLPVSIITPGIHKVAVLDALKNLAPHYSQVVLAGYAPFVKDIIDEAILRHIPLKRHYMRFVFAAEAISEGFRGYLFEKTGMKNLYRDTLNIYGSAELGAMAVESTTSILVRRLAKTHRSLFRSIFSPIDKTPTLAQYNPLHIAFEAPEGNILISGNTVIPFLRYSIGDNGGVLSFDEVQSTLSKYHFDIHAEARKAGVGKCVYELPFVFVYERSDFSLKLHLRDIYPEIIRDVLITNEVSKFLTGKLTMSTKYNEQHNQCLELHLEMKKEIHPNRIPKINIYRRILDALYHRTTGPGNPLDFVNRLKKEHLLKIIYWPHEHPLHFQPGIKQKWVKK